MSEPTTEPREVGITHPANLLTLTRLVFAPLLFWFVLDADANRGASWAAFGLGIALAVTDFFDGRVARRSNVVSRSGAFLDRSNWAVAVVSRPPAQWGSHACAHEWHPSIT